MKKRLHLDQSLRNAESLGDFVIPLTLIIKEQAFSFLYN